MSSQQMFVAVVIACLALHHVVAVVNTGQNKKVEESVKGVSESKENEKVNPNPTGDLVAESSEKNNRREAPALGDAYVITDLSYLPAAPSNINLPVPIYGVPNVPSNNLIYPAPPPDIPPPLPPKPLSSPLYGNPSLSNIHGVSHINRLPLISKGYGPPYPKYQGPSVSLFKPNLVPPKPIYGPPLKNTYGPPLGKPIKFNKYPPKNFGFRPPKPVYGAPSNYKDSFSYGKFHFNTNNLNGLFTNSLSSGNSFSNSLIPGGTISNLYSEISPLNHQYGAPILPPKQTISIEYVPQSTGLSSETDITGSSVHAYGPPQPSPNPKPPHPGAPAPPTPPDIKYDGWQPIPGLVSKRPGEEVHHLAVESDGYNNLSPSPLGQNQLTDAYGPPSVTLDIGHGNRLLSQQGLSDSYGVPLNTVTGLGNNHQGVSDSYNAPLGTVTGSGGVIASSGADAHGAHAVSQQNTLNIDLSSIGLDHGSDIQATQSAGFEIFPQGGSNGNDPSSIQISDTYGTPQLGSQSSSSLHSSGHSYGGFGSSFHGSQNSLGSYGNKGLTSSSSSLGLVPPSGLYGVPPSSQYGTPLYTNTRASFKPPKRPVIHKEPIPHGLFQSIVKDSYNRDIHTFGGGSTSSYVPLSPPPKPSSSYGPVIGGSAISYQNVVHGSSSAGLEINQHSSNIQIDGASALPLTSYNVPLGAVDGSYSLPSISGGLNIAGDHSHQPISNDFTQEKHASVGHDCGFNTQQQVPSLAYGVPSADSYTSSLSSLTTNIATAQAQSGAPYANYGVPDLVGVQPQIMTQYGIPDLSHSASVKTENKINSINSETHGKSYGKSVAQSFGPNSELVESQSLDLNNIPLQGNLGSYTLQIQSADGSGAQVPHTQVLNEGLLQSILQAIEQPRQKGQNEGIPVIQLQPSIEHQIYSSNDTLGQIEALGQSEASEIREVRVEAPKSQEINNNVDNDDDEESLQLLDTSNIALYYKKDDDTKKVEMGDDKSVEK